MRRFISSEPVLTDSLRIRVLKGDKELAKRAALARGQSLAEFVREAMVAAASQLAA